MFTVDLTTRASKHLRKTPEPYKTRIKELLLTMRSNPIPSKSYDVKKLKGEKDTYRVRLGDFRVIYEVAWDQNEVNVLVIRRRETAYDQASS